MIEGAVGFRAKTGRAIAVVLSGTAGDPTFVWRGEVSLVDPALPATAEPYHEVMELPWQEGTVAVQKFAAAIEAVATRALADLVEQMQSNQVEIRHVGVVGSPPRRLESLGNLHIRAHAAEGILFRRVLEVAAAVRSLPCVAFSDRDLNERAPAALHVDVEQMKKTLKQMGRAAGPPWQADERLSATAAWLALVPGSA